MLRSRFLAGTAIAAAIIIISASAAPAAAPQIIREVPQACTVISAQEIARTGSTSVADALKNIPAPGAASPSCGTVPHNAFGRDALAAHNRLRSRYGVPPMQWRDDLELGATARAQQMAANHQLSHAPREGRGTIRENILQAPISYSTIEMINLWTRETDDFIPGAFPAVCKSGGECTGVYHATQMLWPTTFFVGCGEASDGVFTYASCWYDQGGNKDGKEVGTPVAAAQGYDSWIRTRPVNQDYGFDGALFVGYDLGAFRLEAEAAYKRAGIDDIGGNGALPRQAATPNSPLEAPKLAPTSNTFEQRSKTGSAASFKNGAVSIRPTAQTGSPTTVATSNTPLKLESTPQARPSAPPPPPPTASDDAPGGNEDNHPLVGYGAEAFIRHSAAIDCGNTAAAEAELTKLRYAIDELQKRFRAAKRAGEFSAVKPQDVQRQIDLLQSFLRAAEQRRPRTACPTPAAAPSRP